MTGLPGRTMHQRRPHNVARAERGVELERVGDARAVEDYNRDRDSVGGLEVIFKDRQCPSGRNLLGDSA